MSTEELHFVTHRINSLKIVIFVMIVIIVHGKGAFFRSFPVQEAHLSID